MNYQEIIKILNDNPSSDNPLFNLFVCLSFHSIETEKKMNAKIEEIKNELNKKIEEVKEELNEKCLVLEDKLTLLVSLLDAKFPPKNI